MALYKVKHSPALAAVFVKGFPGPRQYLPVRCCLPPIICRLVVRVAAQWYEDKGGEVGSEDSEQRKSSMRSAQHTWSCCACMSTSGHLRCNTTRTTPQGTSRRRGHAWRECMRTADSAARGGGGMHGAA